MLIIFDFQKSILVLESALCNGPFICPKTGEKAVVDITLHYITM